MSAGSKPAAQYKDVPAREDRLRTGIEKLAAPYLEVLAGLTDRPDGLDEHRDRTDTETVRLAAKLGEESLAIAKIRFFTDFIRESLPEYENTGEDVLECLARAAGLSVERTGDGKSIRFTTETAAQGRRYRIMRTFGCAENGKCLARMLPGADIPDPCPPKQVFEKAEKAVQERTMKQEAFRLARRRCHKAHEGYSGVLKDYMLEISCI